MKIGIIGGGIAGLISAWLLEKDFDVVLLEKQNRLGGQAETLYVNTDYKKNIPVEMGFEFFNKKMYPNLCKLTEVLNIPVRPFNLTYSFENAVIKDFYLLPPISNNNKNKFRIDKKIFHPNHLANMAQMVYFIFKSNRFLKKNNKFMSIKEFLDNMWITESFKNNLLYPMLAAGWGADIESFKDYSAWDIFSTVSGNYSYFLWPHQWLEIKNGSTCYINILTKQLYNTEINLEATINNILYDTYKKQYIIFTSDNNFIVDHLIIATDANAASQLIKNLDRPDEYSVLNNVNYIKTCIAAHSDTRFLPKLENNWSVANVRYDGVHSALTTYKPWHSEFPIFRSWIPIGLDIKDMPMPLYGVRYFYHAKVDTNYFIAQEAISKSQGYNNLWFASFYTTGADIHENSINSGIYIAKKLAPNSERLRLLVNT